MPANGKSIQQASTSLAGFDTETMLVRHRKRHLSYTEANLKQDDRACLRSASDGIWPIVFAYGPA